MGKVTHPDLQGTFWELDCYEGLTDKQKLFVEYYCATFNASKSAKMAGYAPDNPGSQRAQGLDNLANPIISKCIAERMKVIGEASKVTHEMITAELSKIAFTDITEYVDIVDGKPVFKSKEAFEMGAGRVVKSFTVGKRGEVKFTVHDKQAAIEMLARHTGYFAQDNAQKTPENNVNFFIPDNGRENVESNEEGN